MSIKSLPILLLTFLVTNIAIGQDNYDKFIKALISGDTILAKKISDDNSTVEPINTREFKIKNVPEYVFNIESNKLKDTLLSFFNLDNQFSNKFLNRIFYSKISKASTMSITFEAETSKDTLFSKEYFSKPNTSNDIFLHDFGEFWESKYYFSKNHSLKYTANFVIRLNRINDNSTKVSIMADNPEIINGILEYGVHGPVARHTSVQPTTIEEYTILEFIASKLGDTTLLPLKLPTKK